MPLEPTNCSLRPLAITPQIPTPSLTILVIVATDPFGLHRTNGRGNAVGARSNGQQHGLDVIADAPGRPCRGRPGETFEVREHRGPRHNIPGPAQCCDATLATNHVGTQNRRRSQHLARRCVHPTQMTRRRKPLLGAAAYGADPVRSLNNNHRPPHQAHGLSSHRGHCAHRKGLNASVLVMND